MNGRILIVDDEESIRFTFGSFLAREGHEVLVAEDYASALGIISRIDLDLIFVDILLGGYSGIDILREIKKSGLRCPVVMITGEPSAETAADSVRLGAFDYLFKPVRKEALVHMTNMALHHKVLIDEKVRIEAEKEKYRSNMEAIFRSVKDAIITVDIDMRVIEANEATAGICGTDPGKIVGKGFGDVLNQCHKSCHKVLKEILKTKSAIREYRIECRHQRRPHQVVLLTGSPLTDRDGKFVGAVLVIRDITRLADLERELKERHQFRNIIGKSRKMQDIYRLLEDLADTETTVLVTGESGTGKELVAKALHYGSIRTAKPLVKVNCSALAETLLESELFGHVKGAFTGALRDNVGRFQMANGGTIMLDEIGDISPRIQLKLLRVLQEKEFERVGDSATVKADVRVIATTNLNLREKVRMGEFREDLYYRLKVVEVALPPLRERVEDIPLFVDHFRNLFNKGFKKKIEGISDEVQRIFMHYPWPGNIRELEHAIEHAFVLCHGSTIMVEHLPSEVKEYSKTESPVTEIMPHDEPQKIVQALDKTGWNKAKAARLLGVSRQTIYRKIDEYKLTKPIE
ncbi:MAG: sigma-54-dependent Fis family transcriptional regulator [Proteobacteria bacterium]|nr:sigma-54-dependent Fis family transcriptional regulator [Pseudomonadota bacterium]